MTEDTPALDRSGVPFAVMDSALLSRVLDELSSSGAIGDRTWAELMASSGHLSEPERVQVAEALERTRGLEPLATPPAFEPPETIGGAILARAA